ncbi:ATP-binding protein [Actinomadura viridis]|uniref:ATP-binding protein n=1 Tax=Actinomadura viridis TaxID=58110 RepID=UPI0036CD0147
MDADVKAASEPLPGACDRPAHRHRTDPACATCQPGSTWTDHLADEQANIQRWGLDEKTVFLGIDVARRRLLERLAGRTVDETLHRQAKRLDNQVQELSDLVAGAGLAAVPATARQMEWLMHRSCSLGLPPPLPLADQPAPVPHALAGHEPTCWESGDLEEFTGRARWACEPFDRTVTVTGISPDGTPITRHVAVLTLGAMAPLDIPESTPWLQRTDALPFEVEWSITFEVRRAAEVTREMRDKIARRRNQLRHYQEHDLEPPLELEEQTEESRRIEDEQQHGFGGVRSRIRGWFRLAVVGETRAEALARAAQVAELYEPAITVIHPADQYRLAREFIPGERLANLAHCRRMPVTMLVAGMPQATSRIGDPGGFFIGFTSAGCRAVTWAPWRGTEIREESGLVPILGTQGAGKSTLAGLITYKSVRAGVAATVLDPAGMLAALCQLPALAGHATAIDLLNAEPGTLCPYRVIPDPRLDDIGAGEAGRAMSKDAAEHRWKAEVSAAQARRRALTYDVLRMLIEPDMLDKETIFCLKEAVDRAPATCQASPWDVIDALKHLGSGLSERAQLIARDFERSARLPEANLFFPAGPATDGLDLDGLGLTVLTLRGLVVPNQSMPASEWSTEERFSVPLLHLAAWLTHRLVYGRPRHQRKLLIIDEAHAITRSPVGRMLINTTARDSRKRNTIALVCSQNGEDLLEAGIGNLRGPALVGRTEGDAEQRQALQLLGLPTGAGYERDLASLSPRHTSGRTGSREFVMRLGGELERIQIDMGLDEALRQALDTTADPTRARTPPEATPLQPALDPTATHPWWPT